MPPKPTRARRAVDSELAGLKEGGPDPDSEPGVKEAAPRDEGGLRFSGTLADIGAGPKGDFAYVVIHFGTAPKYFEMELMLLYNLMHHRAAYPIVYLYANDTPREFFETFQRVGGDAVELQSYDDDYIKACVDESPTETYAKRLSAARTCGIAHALTLTKYSKVCIVESDIVFIRPIDDIFWLCAPSIVVYKEERDEVYGPTNNVNGGVMLLAPDADEFERVKALTEQAHADPYPSERLYKLAYPRYYESPLPRKYNTVRAIAAGSRSNDDLRDLRGIHFANNPKLHELVLYYPDASGNIVNESINYYTNPRTTKPTKDAYTVRTALDFVFGPFEPKLVSIVGDMRVVASDAYTSFCSRMSREKYCKTDYSEHITRKLLTDVMRQPGRGESVIDAQYTPPIVKDYLSKNPEERTLDEDTSVCHAPVDTRFKNLGQTNGTRKPLVLKERTTRGGRLATRRARTRAR
jgi:hypothetical protein